MKVDVEIKVLNVSICREVDIVHEEGEIQIVVEHIEILDQIE